MIRRDPGYRPPPPPPRPAPPAAPAPSPRAGHPPRRPPPPPPPPPPVTAVDRVAAGPAARPHQRRRRPQKRRWGRRIFARPVAARSGRRDRGGRHRALDRLRAASRRRCSATTPTARPPGAGTTWLLVGSDSREGLTPEQQAELTTGGDLGNGRTDTILVVHIPALGSDAPTTMVSIPRDSYVDIPGYGKDKINAAFAEGGAPLLAQTVEQATGLRLDHYAEVGFGGFADARRRAGRRRRSVPPTRSATRWPGSTCPPVARPSTAATRWGTSAPGRHRVPTWTGWSTSESSCPPLLHRASSPAVWLNPWRWYADAARRRRRAHRRQRRPRLGSRPAGLGAARVDRPPSPCRSASSPAATRDRSWCGTPTPRPQLFDALRSDSAIPQEVLDAPALTLA